VGRRGLVRTPRGVGRWPGAVSLLSIGASYLALSDYVTVVPRLWLPALMTVLVVALLSAHAGALPFGAHDLFRAPDGAVAPFFHLLFLRCDLPEQEDGALVGPLAVLDVSARSPSCRPLPESRGS
jgi:hypothetical protein